MNIDPDALHCNDNPNSGEGIHTGLPWNHAGRLDGHPGLVWYSEVRRVRGDRLAIGDWLDSLDHRGARKICDIRDGRLRTDWLHRVIWALGRRSRLRDAYRIVVFSFGDTETVHRDVEYDVVDPASQVAPDGTPVIDDWPELEDSAL